MVRAEHGAEAAEAGHDLVDDEKDVVTLKHLLDRRPVARRRRHDAAGAQHRFTNEGGNGVGALTVDQRFQLGHTLGGELFLGLIQIVAAEVIGRLGVDHL